MNTRLIHTVLIRAFSLATENSSLPHGHLSILDRRKVIGVNMECFTTPCLFHSPAESDTHNWFREHAANRRHYDAAQRNYELYWRPRLDNMIVGPTVVTNTYKQDQLEREMQYEIDNPWSSSMMGIVDWEDTVKEDEVIINAAQEVTVEQDLTEQEETTEDPVGEEMVVVEISHDDEYDDCAFGIRLCMSY